MHNAIKMWSLLFVLVFLFILLCIHLPLLVLLLDAIISWKNYHLDQNIWILYDIPNHSSQNKHERLVMLPFLVEYSGWYPGEIQSLDRQDWDRIHSCDNHIMSCEIRIFNETPLSAIKIRVCHPPEQAETFPDWLSRLYWSSISIYFAGAFNP